jgi:hypothetical protein
MDWLFDNFQIVALIAIVIGSLVKRFLEAKMEERQARERMDREPPEPEEIFGPEEDWQPPAAPAEPPPLTRQSPAWGGPPPLPAAVAQPAAEEVLQRQLEMQERLRQIRETKAAQAREHARETAAARAKPAQAPAGLRAALRQRSEIRRAVVMREILGPPVGR